MSLTASSVPNWNSYCLLQLIGPLIELITWLTFGKRENGSLLNNFSSTSSKSIHGTKSPVFWWFYQTVNVLKMPRSRSVFSFRNSQGKLGVHNPLTPGKYAVYFTFSSTRKTWLNSALSLVNRTFYQTVNVRKISRSWLVFPLRKRQGQLGIHHYLTEGKYAVHVTLSSTCMSKVAIATAARKLGFVREKQLLPPGHVLVVFHWQILVNSKISELSLNLSLTHLRAVMNWKEIWAP